MSSGVGRFAPSPTGDLHLGNLRTAVLAWLFARHTGRAFALRMEDLDRERVAAAPGAAVRQLADLAALGIDHDGPILYQSQRDAFYRDALTHLETYPCFCTRREIAEASSAPHGTQSRYPGTCRELTSAQRRQLSATRPAAIRVNAHTETVTVTDRYAGTFNETVDDFVVFRNDGCPAYNLAVVVDDLATGVDQVVRGSDLLDSAPRQAWLTAQLGGTAPQYAHVPLVLNEAGQRLSKRDHGTTLAALAARQIGPERVLAEIACSLGLAEPSDQPTLDELLAVFDPDRLPHQPWIIDNESY